MTSSLSLFLLIMVEGLKALVFVNGFPVYCQADLEPERVVQKVTPYLKTGTNEIEVFLWLPASAVPRAEEVQGFKVLLTVAGADRAPADGTAVLEHAWDGGTHPLAADGSRTLVYRKMFQVTAQVGPWAWEKAVVPPVEPDREALYRFVSEVAAHLRTGSPQRILPMLSHRNREMAKALGLPEDRMNSGFSQGLADLAAAEDFSVDLPKREDIRFRWERKGRWFVPLRDNGDAAIQITSDGNRQPFGVVVGWIDGTWTIIR